MEPGLCILCSQSQTILTSSLWTYWHIQTHLEGGVRLPNVSLFYHITIATSTSVSFMCVIMLINATYICIICTCFKVWLDWQCVRVCWVTPQRIEPSRWCGPKTHKDQGDTRDKFWQKRPGRCFTHAIWLAVLHVPVYFDWLCYISWTQNGAPFVTDT